MRNFLFIVTIVLISMFLTWAPWLNDQKLHDEVLNSNRPHQDKTIDDSGNLVCDYSVIKFPLGRWVASCEGGYYVTFWGQIIP